MRSVNARRPPWRAIVVAILAAPAISLLVASALVWGTSQATPTMLPLGMHTLLPAALLLPMPVLEAIALLNLGLAGLAYAAIPAGRRDEPIGALQATVLVVAAQALLFAAQLVVVDQVRGVPDAALVMIAAVALQAIVVALAAAASVVLGGILTAEPAHAPVSIRLVAAPAQVALAPVFVSSQVYRLGARRGPPSSLLTN